MLWNIIRDFIVQYITGGFTSGEESYSCFIGYDYVTDTGVITDGASVQAATNFSVTFGDWLATTITVVIMILLVVFAVWLVRWIFKAVSSAFLLK